jgi:drug/metabolite transporter (DMT)-like permease
MATGAFFFSVMAALVKLAGATLPVMEVVVVRSAVTAGLSWLGARKRRSPLLGKEPRLLFLRGVFGFVSLSCFYIALVLLPLADAMVIQFTNPVFTALIAMLLLGEALKGRDLLLTLGSLSGVILVARPSFLFGSAGAAALDPLAVGIALCGAVFSATAYVLVRRLRAEEPMVVIFWFGWVSVLFSIPFLLFSGPRWPTGAEWLVLVGVGVSTHMGQVFLTRGLALEAAGRATAIGYLQILFAMVWGFLLFDDLPDGPTLAGAAIIIGCTLLLTRSRRTPGAVPAGGGGGRS